MCIHIVKETCYDCHRLSINRSEVTIRDFLSLTWDLLWLGMAFFAHPSPPVCFIVSLNSSCATGEKHPVCTLSRWFLPMAASPPQPTTPCLCRRTFGFQRSRKPLALLVKSAFFLLQQLWTSHTDTAAHMHVHTDSNGLFSRSVEAPRTLCWQVVCCVWLNADSVQCSIDRGFHYITRWAAAGRCTLAERRNEWRQSLESRHTQTHTVTVMLGSLDVLYSVLIHKVGRKSGVSALSCLCILHSTLASCGF